MGKVATEATLREGVEVLKVIAKSQINYFESYADIANIVKSGLAQEFFEIGDQIVTKFTKGTTEYDCPWDVVAFRDVELEDGSTVHGMVIQMHYASLDGVQFDQNEAFYVVTDSPLVAGTYYITMGNAWGSNVVANKTYHFTLTQDVPVGGQLQIGTATAETSNLPDTAPANWRVRVYASADTATPTEILTMTEGASGTSLGTLSSSTKYGVSGMNNMQRAGYGYNRWGQSALRQYLNSDATENDWWTPQNPYDRVPNQLATIKAFKQGLPSAFVDIIKPVKVVTALNTVSDSEIGTTETTYDAFFPASLEEEYIVPQLSGVEGAYFPYWKNTLELDSPQAQGAAGTNANHIRFALENHSSAQTCRLRSANRGYATYAWLVYPSGTASSGGYATTAYRFAPACVIC